MKDEHNLSEEQIFAEALRLPTPEDRAAYLAQACGSDEALRRRIEALLRAHDNAGKFLDQPPAAASPGTLLITTAMLPVAEKPGDRIGRYKLLQQIGEGGCGVVYMAEQQELVKRRVALKVIKPGMDTRQVLARFEAERQALALMDHPNIAKVLDAGATDTGRPFFVMELVRGVKITDYCDDPQNKLSTEQRLDLFIQICRAIQHAHQKGIIHRDIKPSNILVTLQEDGTPTPKIIDFGIAKATAGQTLTDKTLFTAFEQFIGTPAYMAPEQAQMTAIDIDTRSDIYSLGVLLYELLTGKTPFDSKRLMEAGLDEIRRIISEEEPPRPSTRLSTLDAGEQTTVAKCRQSDPPKLIHLVRGDLDWIVMKCLEKDRSRRYETANGLARDIERHLNNEPIVARPPSSLYRFQKMVRRNRLAFTAAGAIATALLVGIGVSTSLFLAERQAERAATAQAERAVAAEHQWNTEARKSQQVAQFLKDMLGSVGPSVALGRDTTMLREILDKTAERVGTDLTDQPAVQAELCNTIGEVYEALGEYPQAEAMQREALALRKTLFGTDHPDVAASLDSLAYALRYQEGKQHEAETMSREALAMRRKFLGNEHTDVATSLSHLGSVLRHQGKLEEAESLFREALAMRRKLQGNQNPDVVSALDRLAFILLDRGKLAEAETAMREALSIRSSLSGNQPSATNPSESALFTLLYAQGKLPEAEALLRENLANRRKLLGTDHPFVAITLSELGTVLHEQGELAEAEGQYRQCLLIREKSLPDTWYLFYTRSVLGGTLLEQKNYAEAEPLLLSGYEGMKQREARIPERDKVLREALQRLVQLYETTGRSDQAAEWKQKLTKFDKAQLIPNSLPRASNSNNTNATERAP
jgi:serine/threonine protein kinase